MLIITKECIYLHITNSQTKKINAMKNKLNLNKESLNKLIQIKLKATYNQQLSDMDCAYIYSNCDIENAFNNYSYLQLKQLISK